MWRQKSLCWVRACPWYQKAALLRCPTNPGLHEPVGIKGSILPCVGEMRCQEDSHLVVPSGESLEPCSCRLSLFTYMVSSWNWGEPQGPLRVPGVLSTPGT